MMTKTPKKLMSTFNISRFLNQMTNCGLLFALLFQTTVIPGLESQTFTKINRLETHFKRSIPESLGCQLQSSNGKMVRHVN